MDAKHVNRRQREAEASRISHRPQPLLIIIVVAYMTMAIFACFIAIQQLTVFVGVKLDAGEPVPVILTFLLTFAFARIWTFIGLFLFRVLFPKPPRERWLRLERFAAANGLEFATGAPNPGFPGTIFTVGDERSVMNVMPSTSLPPT